MSSDASSPHIADQELQFKKRARRRLVGAIALVLLMVIILPMILHDNQEAHHQQPIAIYIPDPAEVPAAIAQPQPHEVKQQALPAPEPVAVPTVEPVPAQTTEIVEKQKTEETPSVLPHSKPEQQIPDAENHPVTQKENQHLEATPTKQVNANKSNNASTQMGTKEKPVTKPSEKSVDPSKGNAVKEASSVEQPYYVQIGVYSDESNVKNIEKKLRDIKLKVYTEKISSDKGEKIRIKVGPFPSRTQADAASDRAKTIGLNGFVSNK